MLLTCCAKGRPQLLAGVHMQLFYITFLIHVLISIFLSLPLFFSITDLKFDVALINLSEIIQSLDSVLILRASLKVYWVEWRRLGWVTIGKGKEEEKIIMQPTFSGR